jgi:predicted flap endonuclease-1-like 5' DNA nuclease
MTSEEPPTKKAKAGSEEWDDHTLNCSEAIMKNAEGLTFTEISTSPVSVLQGIGPVSSKVLEELKIKTVKDLGNFKFFKLARALKTLAATETKGGRPAGSIMNVDKAVIKDFETKSLQEIIDAPIHEIEGMTEKAEELLKELGVSTIEDLATWKYSCWAESIVTLASFEETMTEQERKELRVKKMLA